MNASIQSHLALILFLPWFAILGALFWLVPRQPRTRARRAFDVATLASAVIAFVLAMRFGYAEASTGSGGNVWRQILATALGYIAFLLVMATGWYLRARWLRRQR